MAPWYTTRERVKSSLEVVNTSRADQLVDAKIAAATRIVEGFLHRRFYPERKTVSFDWPNSSSAPSWVLELDDNELISVETLTAGGIAIPSTDFFLRRGDDKDEPPYSRLEIDLGGSAAFHGADTAQRAIQPLGLYGFNDTATNYASASLGVTIDASENVIVLNPASSGFLDVGVGSLVLIGTERMLLVDRRMRDTAVNTAGTLDAEMFDVVLSVVDGTAFAYGETILVDGERMRVDDIAGNNLIVTRAWDGSTLAAHASGVDVYALRSLLVERHALGSIAAVHTAADPVYTHEYPAPVSELTNAEAVVLLTQNSAAYASTSGSGEATSASSGSYLKQLRESVRTAYGRKNRSGAV